MKYGPVECENHLWDLEIQAGRGRHPDPGRRGLRSGQEPRPCPQVQWVRWPPPYRVGQVPL